MSENKTVLIIDDEPFNIDILKEHLEDENYTILSAENGQLGLDILNQNKDIIDVILLDRMMPVMTGMEFLAVIKNDDTISTIPIIMQTAAASDSDVIEGINAGAYYYLTKPFQADMMLSIVKAAISDYSRHKKLNKSVISYDSARKFVNEIKFHIKTLDDIDIISSMIAALCPEPMRVAMGITELLINSIEHGNLEITYCEKTELINKGIWRDEVNNKQLQSKHKDKYTSIKLSHTESEIIIVIRDHGNGFDYKKYLTVDPSRAFDPHGRGIAIGAMLSFDKIEFIGCGNEVHCFINK